jgi:hypothetical protein
VHPAYCFRLPLCLTLCFTGNYPDCIWRLQKDIIFYDNDADYVILDPDWDSLLEGLRQRLPRSYRVFYVVPSEDRSIKWIRVMTGVGIMDLVRRHYNTAAACLLAWLGKGFSLVRGH